MVYDRCSSGHGSNSKNLCIFTIDVDWSIASQNMIFHFGNDLHNPVHFSFLCPLKCANNIYSHIHVEVSLLLIGLKEMI